MRSTTLWATAALALSAVLSACQKQELESTPVVLPNFKVEQGMLHFETTADYQTMTDMPSEGLRSAFLQKVRSEPGFTSAERALGSGSRSVDQDLLFLIDDPYFREMLNENLCVWIDDHIFRVNPEDGKVYVIPSSGVGDKYDDLLAQNTDDEDVREFPIDVNVLDEVDRPDALWPFCSESGVPAQNPDPIAFNDNSGRTATARYAKYGIYFTVFAKVEPVNSSGPFMDFYFKGIGPWDMGEGKVFYRQKCGNTVDYKSRSQGTWQLNNRRFQSYQGSKGLNRLYFYFRPIKLDCPDPVSEGVVIGNDGDPCAEPFFTDAWVGFQHNY